MAGLLDLGGDAVVTGRAAAALHRLDGFEPDLVQFLVPRRQRRRKVVGEVTSTPRLVPPPTCAGGSTSSAARDGRELRCSIG
jgi:hypothetical protein